MTGSLFSLVYVGTYFDNNACLALADKNVGIKSMLFMLYLALGDNFKSSAIL
jgi:hypothetical protein